MRISLTPEQAAKLQEIVRRSTEEARLHRRARMVLLAAAGESVSAIAVRIGTNRLRVGQWLRCFAEQGVDGLRDRERSGRPPEITALERHQVVAAACQSPRQLKIEREIWSHEALAQALMDQGLVRSISSTTVGRVLQEAEIKPHRVRGWCHSTDPLFQEKMAAIVRLYVDSPAGEPVLSIDEKTGMQALSRSRPLQPAGAGRAGRFEFDYKRHGTQCLFACFNVRTGKILGRLTEHRTRQDFFSFMDEVAIRYRQRRVHLVLDNLNTHKDTTRGTFLSDWNRAHGNRFIVHYTPTHGSWLNQVELWFSLLSRRILRYGNFASRQQLVEAVERFIQHWNLADAQPFRWTYEGRPLVST
jgi:transposase